MDKAGAVIMALCCFGCASLFTGIGVWAGWAKKPVHFWSGTKLAPEKIHDIPGYNRANAVMWKRYSIPYWLAGALSCMGTAGDGFLIAATALLFIGCFPGMLFLVGQYRRIEKRYLHR